MSTGKPDEGPPKTESLIQAIAPAQAAGCLIYVADSPGPDRGRHYRLERGRARVGSAPPCDLVIQDTTVSRQHAQLSVRNDGILVEDLGSTNGTFYLGQRVDRAVLKLGSRLHLGRCAVDILPLPTSQGDAVVEVDHYGDLVGSSLAMRRLYAMLQRLSGSDVPVLIHGETGTGKELVARAIHSSSQRATKPFVIVDCGQVQKELINSELFGHKRGSFTGAVSDRDGAFQSADGGTVFLDEIGELPLELQPKLLRVLESGEITRVGESVHTRVNVRIVAATHRDLEELVRAGRFREDLFFRLAVITMTTPSLRERLDDIPLLVANIAKKLGGEASQLPEAALEFMKRYQWPGNVRELRNAVQRLLVLGTLGLTEGVGGSGAGRAGASTSGLHNLNADMKYRDAREAAIRDFEAFYLRSVIEKSGDNLSKAARVAGIDRKYLRDLLKKHGLYSGSGRDEE